MGDDVISASDIIRVAMNDKKKALSQQPTTSKAKRQSKRPMPQFGAVASGHTDTARLAGEIPRHGPDDEQPIPLTMGTAKSGHTGTAQLASDGPRSIPSRDRSQRRRHERMVRTIVTLPDDLLRRAKALAAERGISMAELFRETLENGLKGQRPKPKGIGMFESAETDLGRQVGDMKFEPPSWR